MSRRGHNTYHDPMDNYQNFRELARNEREGRDFVILSRQGRGPFAVMAPHGGGIEPGTQDIADALAGEDFSFYAFSAVREAGNRRMHLTSNRFDEPRALAIARRAAVVVTVHGSADEGETVLIGGRNLPLGVRIRDALNGAGFSGKCSDIPGIRGMSPDNICNRGTSGQGVQLEIGRGLRKKMFVDFPPRPPHNRTSVFSAFVTTIRKVLLAAAKL